MEVYLPGRSLYFEEVYYSLILLFHECNFCKLKELNKDEFNVLQAKISND
eukprot:UN15576